MSVVNHEWQFIFLHEPHTGGRAIEKALMTLPTSCNFNGEHHILVDDMIDKGFVAPKQFDEYKKFRVIRNPYDWLVTCWTQNDKRRKPFYDWAITSGLSFMQGGTLFWRYNTYADYEICFERLKNDLFYTLGFQVPLDVIGTTENKPHWSDLLTVRQAKHLADLYSDIHTYGYGVIRYRLERAG